MLVLINSVLLISGCSTGVMSPDDGAPTMVQSYRAAMQQQTSFAQGSSPRNSNNDTVSLPLLANDHSIQPILDTLNRQFPILPNPQSVMYIFGHYAGDEQLPVPGHFTAFPLYLENHYAIPNEIIQPYNDGQFTQGDNHA